MVKRVSLKGKGADIFFGDFSPVTESVDEPAAPAPVLEDSPAPSQVDSHATPVAADPPEVKPRKAPRPSRRRAESTPSEPASNGVSTLASTLASSDSEAIAAIRKVVKTPGKEVSFIRLTPEEKAQLADIVYTYKRQGQKTTENEINRIAINSLLLDYHENGEHSVLARVLAALLA